MAVTDIYPEFRNNNGFYYLYKEKINKKKTLSFNKNHICASAALGTTVFAGVSVVKNRKNVNEKYALNSKEDLYKFLETAEGKKISSEVAISDNKLNFISIYKALRKNALQLERSVQSKPDEGTSLKLIEVKQNIKNLKLVLLQTKQNFKGKYISNLIKSGVKASIIGGLSGLAIGIIADRLIRRKNAN